MTNGPNHWGEEHAGRLTTLVEVIETAGRQTLNHFRKAGLEIESKADESPVTIADREAETLVRRLLADRFPHDSLQGEEFAEQIGTGSYRWIVDPIDGTKSFICGVPLYSTLLALEHEGQPIAGAIFIPACEELVVAANGLGCWYRGGRDSSWSPARVSQQRSLQGAVFVVSQVDSFDARGAATAYQTLQRAARITRSWGDGYGYLMVATGRADIMVDPICNAWDVAAILPIIQEAGGRFTDWSGAATPRGGDGVGTNGLVHDEVLHALRCDG